MTPSNIDEPIKTKILATLGPATSDVPIIKALVEAGATAFRLNFSHGSHGDHAKRYEMVRQAEAELGVHLAILADLQGPKIRIGRFENDQVSLKQGQSFTFYLADVRGNTGQVTLPHPEVFESVKVNDLLLIDDGRTRMEATRIDDGIIEARVLHDTVISNSKGVNFPSTDLKLPALTAKDRLDLQFALSLKVDWIALSFVQKTTDVLEARELVARSVKIISKIEKPSALSDIDGIIQASDAIMVARGDLGVECPWHEIPTIQRNLVNACRAAGKPVVVATQMLESMIAAPIPTRAEVSDVANAVVQGADAVMLSAETATGAFPVETVAAMAAIARSAQGDAKGPIDGSAGLDLSDDSASIASAAGLIAQMRNASCILTFSETGATALRVAKGRPFVPVIAVCPEVRVARGLALAWGIRSKISRDIEEFHECRSGKIPSSLLDPSMIRADQPIVVTSGSAFGASGGTDSIKIAYSENIK